jgi:hypothetical protein
MRQRQAQRRGPGITRRIADTRQRPAGGSSGRPVYYGANSGTPFCESSPSRACSGEDSGTMREGPRFRAKQKTPPISQAHLGRSLRPPETSRPAIGCAIELVGLIFRPQEKNLWAFSGPGDHASVPYASLCCLHRRRAETIVLFEPSCSSARPSSQRRGTPLRRN